MPVQRGMADRLAAGSVRVVETGAKESFRRDRRASAVGLDNLKQMCELRTPAEQIS